MARKVWHPLVVVCFMFASLVVPPNVGNTASDLPGPRPHGQLLSQVRAGNVSSVSGNSESQEAQNVQLVGQIGGATRAVALSGSYAYLGVGPRLVFLDVRNPARPAVLGQSPPLPSLIRDIAVLGMYAYVADCDAGLRILNMANPARPVEVASFVTRGCAFGVTVRGRYAYLSDGTLHIVDIFDPTRPREVGFLASATGALKVALSGNYAYVASGASGLSIVDVSDPSRPVLVGRTSPFPASAGRADVDKAADRAVGLPASPPSTESVAVVGRNVYIAGSIGLHILDVSDPARPRAVAVPDLPNAASQVVVAGTYAYVADYDGTAHSWSMHVLDVTNPARPARVGDYFSSTHGSVLALAVGSTMAFVVDSVAGLRILDVANPSQPTRSGSYPALGWIPAVVAEGKYAYVATMLPAFPASRQSYTPNVIQWGFSVVDVSDPARAAVVGSYPASGSSQVQIQTMAVAGKHAYIFTMPSWIDGDYVPPGIRIVDVAIPAQPTEVGFYPVSTPIYRLLVSGHYGYIVESTTLRILDLSHPSQPTQVGAMDLPDDFSDVAVGGSYAYVAIRPSLFDSQDQRHGLRILDVSDPTRPTVGGFYTTSGAVDRVRISGSHAYLLSGDTLSILDISDPADPSYVGSYSMSPGQYYSGLAVAGAFAYVTDWQRVRVIDVSSPTSPKQVHSYVLAGGTAGVAAAGTTANVAGGTAGLYIFGPPSSAAPTATQMRSLHVDVSATVDDKTVSLGRAVQLQDVRLQEGELPSGTFPFSGRVDNTTFTATLALAVTYFQPLTLSVQRFQVALPTGQALDIADVGTVAMTRPGTTGFTLTTAPRTVAAIGAVTFTFTGEVTAESR